MMVVQSLDNDSDDVKRRRCRNRCYDRVQRNEVNNFAWFFGRFVLPVDGF